MRGDPVGRRDDEVCSARPRRHALAGRPGLRPEGKQGPLVRTLSSHLSLLRRWAKTWEFQALLKARPVAGDPPSARATSTPGPLVWPAAERENFVADVQAMRRRVEEHVPPIRSTGSSSSVRAACGTWSSAVQLFQLVHGRADESLRSRTTLDALAALAAGGYVARDDAAASGRGLPGSALLEHRVQVHRLRRTHLMPMRRSSCVARPGMGHRANPAHSVLGQWQRQAREVRRLHESIFYRPLLAAVARLARTRRD